MLGRLENKRTDNLTGHPDRVWLMGQTCFLFYWFLLKNTLERLDEGGIYR